MKKLNLLLVVCMFALHANSQNLIPKIVKKGINVHNNDNRIDIDFDVIDPDNQNLEIFCKIFNASENNKYQEIIPQMIDGDIGFPVIQGANKRIRIFLDLASNQTNLVVVLSAYDREAMDINALVSQVSASELQEHIVQIQGKRNTTDPTHYNASRFYITNKIENYLTSKALPFNSPVGINYEAGKLGYESPSSTIVIDAHYDSAPISPGADDNASGVAGVLEAIRILSDYAFKKSIRFLFFDLEELGLVGSTIYASNQLSKKDSVIAVINLEMIGYYSELPNSQDFPTGFNFLFPEAYNEVVANNRKGDFITNVANTSSSFLKTSFKNNATAYVPGLKVISLELAGNGSIAPDLRRSDHAVFWDRNIPAIMLTDGANFRNKNYHTIRDSVGYLNFNFMSNVVKASIATMAELAGIEHGTSIDIPINLSTFTTQLNKNQFYAFYQNNNILIKSKINTKSLHIELIDSKGISVCAEKINLQSEEFSKFYCSDLKPGIYYIRALFEDGFQTQKILVNGF